MTILLGLMLSLLIMSFVWCLYLYCQNPGIVDVFWSINIAIIGSFYLSFGETSMFRYITLALLWLWCLRLALYLYFTRVKKGEKDKRYESISEAWRSKKLGFLLNYLFQGILGWLLALPFFYISHTDISLIQMVTVSILVAVGIVGESFADWQLYAHCKLRTGKICQKGLWQYSRHPNYFFEWLVWLGFSLMGVSGVLSMPSLISCLTLFIIMWFMTIPITEKQSLEKRGEAFHLYQKQVSSFVPWFRKSV